MTPRWVLLHGTPLDPAAWDEVRRHLTVEAFAPDLNSFVPDASSEGVLQSSIAASILSQVDDEQLLVVGHSLGGQVAMEMALLEPHRVQRLVLVCTRDIPVPEFHRASTALRDGDSLDVGATLRRWFTPVELDDDGPVVRYARRQLQQAPPHRYATALQALAEYDRQGHIARIAAPAVLLCGSLDPGCTPAVMGTLGRDLPRAHLHVVDGWAHMSPFVDPAAFAARLLRAATEFVAPRTGR